MSRDALGDARPQDVPSPPRPVGLDAEDDAPDGAGGHPPPREGRRRAVTTAAVAVAALVLGGLVGHRAGSSPDPASSASAVAASQVPRPSGYAVSLPDEDDPRATRVVVSWAGARDLAPDRTLVVAVVVDDRTRVGRTRLGDPGGGTGGEGGARPAADEVARAVLGEAGEDPAAERGVAVTAVTGRVSGVLVVDVHEDGPDLGVVTAPRVHLAVVEGAEVLHQLALPVGSRRVRS